MQPLTFAMLLMSFSLALGQPSRNSGPFPAASWDSYPLREPLPARSVFTDGRTLFVGGDDSLRASSDGGENWHTLSSLPGNGTITAIWAGEGLMLAARSHAIYRSPDSAATWSKAGGDSVIDDGLRFLAWKDTLVMLTSRFWTYTRMYSVDSGRTWIAGGNWGEDPGSIPNFLGSDPLGKSVGATSLQGNQYVTTETGGLLRRSAAGVWTFLSPGTRPATPFALATAGRNLCMATDLGVSCSQDGGSHFSTISSDRINPNGYSIAVDQERVYANAFINGPIGTLWSRRLGDFDPWVGKENYLQGQLVAARPGLLMLFGRYSGAYRSLDQGAGFKPYGKQTSGTLTMVALGRKLWVENSAKGIYSSSDSGMQWHGWNAWKGPEVSSLAVSDSILFGLGLDGVIRQSTATDTGWTTTPAPPTDSLVILAAGDSVLYAAGPGKLWVRNLYATPAAVSWRLPKNPSRRYSASSRAGFFPPRGGAARDALGKRAGVSAPNAQIPQGHGGLEPERNRKTIKGD
ncbi:MAG: hypothetical protein JF616_18130 [Fibrobacteres bacterium]|nr:hypothetical protein [Fibrobacterota bacterium]